MGQVCDGSTFTCLKIMANRKQHRWIFDIIDNKYEIEPIENLVMQEDGWSLIFEPTQRKLLVVFKDTDLKTLRDLRGKHVAMLEEIRYSVKNKIKADWHLFDLQAEPRHIDFYFHYWPSVYQLHAHVKLTQGRTSDRCHSFRHVIRNLKQNSNWYEDALILYTPARNDKSERRDGKQY